MDQQNLSKHLFGDGVGLVNVDRAEDIDVDSTENSNVSQTVVDISDEGISVSERNFSLTLFTSNVSSSSFWKMFHFFLKPGW